MFDSYDYENLVGPVFLSREFDNDGDVRVRPLICFQKEIILSFFQSNKWEQRGVVCQNILRVCALSFGHQDNWVFSTHIKYPPGSTTLVGVCQQRSTSMSPSDSLSVVMETV